MGLDSKSRYPLASEVNLCGSSGWYAVGELMTSRSIGWAVQVVRAWRRLTQVQLAVRAELTQGCVSSIERGRRDTKMDTLHRIATALGTTDEKICRLAGQLEAGTWNP